MCTGTISTLSLSLPRGKIKHLMTFVKHFIRLSLDLLIHKMELTPPPSSWGCHVDQNTGKCCIRRQGLCTQQAPGLLGERRVLPWGCQGQCTCETEVIPPRPFEQLCPHRNPRGRVYDCQHFYRLGEAISFCRPHQSGKSRASVSITIHLTVCCRLNAGIEQGLRAARVAHCLGL